MRPEFASFGEGEEMTFGALASTSTRQVPSSLLIGFARLLPSRHHVGRYNIQDDIFCRLLRAGADIDPALNIDIDLYTNNVLLLRL
jgi:hypothetical protein